MGKKNNLIKSNGKMTPSVSLVTITQYKRFKCLEILIDIIFNQTYKNIIEWVIVEGSHNYEDILNNSLNIQNLIANSKLNFPIIYVKPENDTKLGGLRNIGNEKCVGDITVCMDDDDFYPNNRVEHAVTKLMSSSYKLAGCDKMLMYDYNLGKLYQFKGFGPNHSTNSCMAWKKEYLLNNKHDETKESGEELSFTQNYTQKMVQLDPKSSVILSSHNSNTYNKKKIIVSIYAQQNDSMKEVHESISKYIDKSILSRYKNLFTNNIKSPYDIVYFCGGFSITWDPADKTLGGSEQAVVHLAENWVKLGKKVAVYGEVPRVTLYGVDYYDWADFPYDHSHDILILWRLFGLACASPFTIKANQICLDIHDNFTGDYIDYLKKYSNKYDKIFLKSEYHKKCFKEIFDQDNSYDETLDKKIIVIPNGIRINEFNINTDNVIRNPYRFCYCSCYTRGLAELLEYVWPIIYKNEPKAELHVYYGMDHIYDERYKTHLKILLSSPGVMDHGRQSMEMVIREKYLSTYHLYITHTRAETDCISIRESLVTGCIPLLSNFGVFAERDGIHYDVLDQNSNIIIAINLIQLLRNPQEVNNYREQFKLSKTIIGWEDISKTWLNYLDNK